MRRARTPEATGPILDRDAADRLRHHLVTSRLAGEVATSPEATLTNCGRLVAGDDDYTFGLSDWRSASFLDAVRAVREVCGGDPGGAPPEAPGYIDPNATMAAIARHRKELAAFAADGGGRVLLATGHPTGLLTHYTSIARALQAAGHDLLMPLDDQVLHHDEHGRPRSIRFLDGVGSVTDGGSLRHTHLARYMQALLDELGARPPDLVIGDHGMAGAAIEAGIATLSIADVNDPALPLAQWRGRTGGVLVIDDGLPSPVYQPLTEAMLGF